MATVIGPDDGKAGMLGSIGVRLMVDGAARGRWHTSWNAGDEPCRILEIISPAGTSLRWVELDGGPAAQPEEASSPAERHGLEVEPESIPGLLERLGLVIGC